MSPAPESPPTVPAPRRRWLRRAVQFLVAVLGLTAAAYLTRSSHVHVWLIERAEAYVHERWGAELVIAEFECDWFTSARLGGVEFEAQAPVPELGGLESATLEELRVEFSALELLRGEWPVLLRGAGLTAELDPRVAELDLTPAGDQVRPMPRLPAIEFERVEITALLDDDRAAIRGGAVSLPAGDWTDLETLLGGLSGQLELQLGPQTIALLGLGEDKAPRLDLRATLARGQLAIDTAQASWARMDMTLERGSVTIAPLTLDLDFDLRADDLALVGAVLDEQAWAGTVRGAVHFEGTWPEIAVTSTLEGAAVLASGRALGDVELGLQLVLDGLSLRGATGGLELRAGPLLAGHTRVEELKASIQLKSDSLYIARASIRQPGNLLELEDLELPRTLDSDVWLARSSGQFRAQLTDLPAALGKASSLAVPQHELVLAGELGDARARITSGTLSTPGGSLTIQSGVLALVEGDEVETELTASLAFSDLAPLGEILGDPTWTGEVHGTLHATGRLPDVVAEVELAGSGVTLRGIPMGEFEAEGRLDTHAFRARSISIRSGGDELMCSGGIVFDGLIFEDLYIEGHVADAARYVPRIELAAGAAALEIDLVLDGPPENLEGRVGLKMQGWSALGLAFEDVELTARASAGRYDIERLSAVLSDGQVTLLGFVEPPAAADETSWKITATSGSFVGEHGDVVLMSPAVLVLAGDGTPRSGEFDLAGLRGLLKGSFAQEAAGLTAHLEGDVSPAREVLDRYLPEGPRWERLAGALTLTPGHLTIDELELESPFWRLAAHGSAPFDPLGEDVFPPGPVDLSAELTHDDLGRLLALEDDTTVPVTGALEASVSLAGSWRELQGVLELSTRELLVLATGKQARFSARALLGDGQLRLERAALEVPERLALNIEGALSLTDTPHEWLADPATELARTEFDLSGEFDLEDLSWLAALVPDFRRTAGAARGRLELAGPLSAPRAEGRVKLTGGELRLRSDIPAMSALEVELEFAGRTITIAHAQGEMGGSPFALAGSLVLASQAAPVGLDLHLTGENLLIHRDRDLLLRADADLTITGALDALTASGRLDLRQPKYTKDVNLLDFSGGTSAPAPTERGIRLFSFSEPPLADMRFDLQIETIEPMLLRNNIVRGGLRPSLHLSGTGRMPRMLGTVFLDPTQIRLPASTVTVNSGTLTFLASDPFVPQLELFATAVKFGHEITVLATGPYDAPELTLTSSPPLAKEDIVMILLTGQFPDQASTLDGSRAATQTVALYLAEDIVSGWMDGGSIEEGQDSFFDGVEIVVGREVTNNGLPTTEVFLRLARGIVSERDQLKLAMELDVWENYNLGLRFVVILR